MKSNSEQMRIVSLTRWRTASTSDEVEWVQIPISCSLLNLSPCCRKIDSKFAAFLCDFGRVIVTIDLRKLRLSRVPFKIHLT